MKVKPSEETMHQKKGARIIVFLCSSLVEATLQASQFFRPAGGLCQTRVFLQFLKVTAP